MGKLTVGIAVALCAAAGMGAVHSFKGDDAQKLEEIRALVAEGNRLQRMDVHPRLYKHPLLKACDFGPRCEEFNGRVSAHAADVAANNFGHPFAEDCGRPGGCDKAEQVWRQAVKAKQEGNK